jgi:putative acetyltransferase
MTCTIRREGAGDAPFIHEVTRAAFEGAPHTSHTEERIVDALRAAGALTLSLVAEVDGRLVGHVAVSPVEVNGGSEGGFYGLGPISVLPGYQRRGVGSALMRAALAELDALGASGCVLLGDPAFYARFGFVPAAPLILPGAPPEYFQVHALRGEIPAGVVRYHAAFDLA